jgi:hypothetical protein
MDRIGVVGRNSAPALEMDAALALERGFAASALEKDAQESAAGLLGARALDAECAGVLVAETP